MMSTSTPNLSMLASPKSIQSGGMGGVFAEVGFPDPTGRQIRKMVVVLLNPATAKVYIMVFTNLASNFEKHRAEFGQTISSLKIM